MIDHLPGTATRRLGIRLMERLRRTDACRLLPGLVRSQWSDPSALAARQNAALRRHLVWCGERVPYYRELFRQLRFAPASIAEPADLQALPLLDKLTIRAAADRLRPAERATFAPRSKSTSGSTGVPLVYDLDRNSHSYLWANIWRAWGQVGYRPGDLYATLSGGSLLPERVDFKQRVYLLLSGCLHLPSYHLTAEVMDRYGALLRRRPVAFLYGYPSSLELFATHLGTGNDRPPPLRAVFTTSELLTDAARRIIGAAFACPVIDTYGCNDGGLYSFECSEHRGFHQGMESCVVEVVDDDGRPLPDGKTGRIVTTHLANRAHPFVRYVTGDIGAIDRTVCRCGRGLLRIVALQGRERDFVLTPDGRKVHGAFFNHFEPFYAADWIERFQIYQPTADRLEVRLITGAEPAADALEDLRRELRRGLGAMEIKFVFPPELESTPTGKFRVVISDL